MSTKALETKAYICVLPPMPSKIADLDRATHDGNPLKREETIFPTAYAKASYNKVVNDI